MLCGLPRKRGGGEDEMIALFDFMPRFCPSCGKQQKWGTDDVRDYYAGCSYTCRRCGLHYASAKPDAMMDANAAAGGDMRLNMEGKR
jgi:endogenous inhibitor of DNA gyrase (YacG/DUF329 family)